MCNKYFSYYSMKLRVSKRGGPPQGTPLVSPVSTSVSPSRLPRLALLGAHSVDCLRSLRSLRQVFDRRKPCPRDIESSNENLIALSYDGSFIRAVIAKSSYVSSQRSRHKREYLTDTL